MVSVTAPGVYVFEESLGPRTIEAVGTSTAALLGRVPKGGVDQRVPVPVHNWTEFKTRFVEPHATSTDLTNAVFGAFANGMTRLWVVPVGMADEISDDDLRPLEGIDEISIVAAPGYANKASYDAISTHCAKMGDRFAIFDMPKEADDTDKMTTVAGGAAAGEEVGFRPSSVAHGAVYTPWLEMQDPLRPGGRQIAPPSGHMAGIYARVDATRGVHKAPANELVRGAIDGYRRISRPEQEVLNPRGVNCIRTFSGGRGLLAWGARTLSDDSKDRYVPVVRLILMIKESIEAGTGWVVFEPNDYPLWAAIRRDVSAFLTLQWRAGALMGQTPAEAFFVKCDAETNPPEVRDAGRVETLIGIAPVKPAEFVIFRLAQTVGQSEGGEG